MSNNYKIIVKYVDMNQAGMVYLSTSGVYYIILSNNLCNVQDDIIEEVKKSIESGNILGSRVIFL
jgi:hypothetical protein